MYFKTPSLEEAERFCLDNNVSMNTYIDTYCKISVNLLMKEERNKVIIKCLYFAVPILSVAAFLYFK